MKSRRLVRRAILVRLYDHLEDTYGLDWPRDAFVNGQSSLKEIDAVLAFKSDPRIDELRGALDRLEHGSFGTCIACKGEISRERLEADPTLRLCAQCEHLYSHIRSFSHHVTPPGQLL